MSNPNMIYDITGKACSSCKGTARTAVVLIDSDANRGYEQARGFFLCQKCFDHVQQAIEQENGVLYMDDVYWEEST